MTVLSVIKSAMRRIGALASGETPTADETADALEILNNLVGSWQNERLITYTITRTTWPIVASTGSYTLGLTGDIAIDRPVFVTQIKAIDTSQDPDVEIDLGRLLTEAEYASIPDKDQTGTFPTCCYYNPTFPLGTVTFWPVPTSSTLLGAISAWAPITSFASLATTITLPPGYNRALVSNLAIELADEWGRPVTANLQRIADQSKAVIKVANYRPIPLACDEAIVGAGGTSWNIETNSYNRSTVP